MLVIDVDLAPETVQMKQVEDGIMEISDEYRSCMADAFQVCDVLIPNIIHNILTFAADPTLKVDLLEIVV